MKAILSATENDFYALPLPLVVWSWKQLGIECKVFVPAGYGPKLQLAMTYCEPETDFHTFTSTKEKEVTYAQVSRLFGWTLPGIDTEESIVTGDADLAVFNAEFFDGINNGCANIVGADLLDELEHQYPMCFIAMPKLCWMEAFDTNPHNGYQEFLDELVGSIECENFRGNQWSLDQHLAYKKINASKLAIIKYPRAALPNRWATRRADRDGWHFNTAEIIDAHLPRPLNNPDNWAKTIQLFKDVYPHADIAWMDEYRNQYLEL